MKKNETLKQDAKLDLSIHPVRATPAPASAGADVKAARVVVVTGY